MRASWGRAPWRREDIPTRALQSSQPDVAIVGGGLTGVSAAYHVARRGLRAVLLEAGQLGDGASGRTGGIVLEGTAYGVLEGTGECVPSLARLVQTLGIKCDLQLPGCWEIEHRSGRGNAALPWIDEGSPVRIANTVAGGTVNPIALLAGIARAAAEAGAVLHEHAAVKRIVARPRPVLELDGATIEPRFVIVGVNAWMKSLLPNLPQLSSALTFACVTESLDASTMHEIGLGAGIPFYTLDLPYLWGRQLDNRQVMFGAGLFVAPPQELERADIETGEPAAILARLQDRIGKLTPALRDVRFVAGWCGPIAFPHHHAPLIGHLAASPSILFAGGYAGHGVALSVWAGERMAAAIADGAPLPSWGSDWG